MMRNCLAVGVVIGASLVVANSASATTAAHQAMLIRHQLSDCMTKQMAASKTISYYEALKVCKERLKAQAAGLSASNAAKPANAR